MPCRFWIDPAQTGSAAQSPVCHLGRVGAIVAESVRHPAMQRCDDMRSDIIHPSTVFFRLLLFSSRAFTCTDGDVNEYFSSGDGPFSSRSLQRGAHTLSHSNMLDCCPRRCAFRASQPSLSLLSVLQHHVLTFLVSCSSFPVSCFMFRVSCFLLPAVTGTDLHLT